MRREAQQHRGLIDAAGATGVLDPGKQQARIVAQRRGNSPQQRRAHGRASGRDASLGQRQNVGTGKRLPSQVAEIVASRDRLQAGITAPSQGLELVEVRYDGSRVRYGRDSR